MRTGLAVPWHRDRCLPRGWCLHGGAPGRLCSAGDGLGGEERDPGGVDAHGCAAFGAAQGFVRFEFMRDNVYV